MGLWGDSGIKLQLPSDQHYGDFPSLAECDKKLNDSAAVLVGYCLRLAELQHTTQYDASVRSV